MSDAAYCHSTNSVKALKKNSCKSLENQQSKRQFNNFLPQKEQTSTIFTMTPAELGSGEHDVKSNRSALDNDRIWKEKRKSKS